MAPQKVLYNLYNIVYHRCQRMSPWCKEKGILIAGPAEDELSVNKALIPVVIGDRLQLTIILRIK